MSIQESIRIVPHTIVKSKTDSNADSIAIVEFDLIGEKVNKFNTPIMMRFKEVVKELQQSSFKAVIFVSKKSKIFIAGADIEEIQSMTTQDQFSKSISEVHEIFKSVEALPMPTFAAIHGACMGGGTEFILTCDYRIASEDSSTRIGLPEIQLGVIPGFGGCVRLPRLVGLEAALGIILAGKSVNAKKAHKMGLVDQLVHPNLLMDQALAWAQEVISSGGKKPRTRYFRARTFKDQFLESPLGRVIVFKQARAGVLKATKGHYPAPLKALEVIQKTYAMSNLSRALEIEREAFCELGISEISKNLIHVFFLTEMVKKAAGVSEEARPRVVTNLGILGAGTMGGGIAYQAADKGISVRMKDLNREALGKGLKHASDLWAKLMKKKVLDKYQFKQKMDLVSGTTDYSGFKSLDVVIEAIVEDMGIKQKVIGEAAKNCKSDCIIATNTSSLSVTEMAQGHPRPEYFAGMHFFNPVDKMPLVEVIRGERTSEETVATIYELAKKMGKMPVVVKDGPGFLVNRLLLPYMAEAAFLLQEGMSIETVDNWYVHEFGMPMGPFALMDEVGLDVCIKVLKIFKKAFGERVEMAPCMEKLEPSGRLGKKNSKGFYKYDEKGKRMEVDISIYESLGLKSPTSPHSSKECLERGIFAMINECALALVQDHIVETAHEVDLAMIMGTGFPPFRGGLLRYADSLGASYVADQLAIYAQQRRATRLKPTTALQTIAKNNKKFY